MASYVESSSLSTIENNSNLCTESDFKDNFNKKLSEFYATQSGKLKKPWTKHRISDVIKQINRGKAAISSGTRRTASEYYWISKYDTVQFNGEYYLILKKSSDDPIIPIIAMEDYFDLLIEIHKDCGHGGRDKMKCMVKNKFYIQKKAIEIFVSLCPVCYHKRNVTKKGIVPKPIVSKDFNMCGQVDLIDFQSIPDGDYKWLLNYQDRATKFLHLRPLRSSQASKVALELLYIFLDFGAPRVLQSDYGPEFTAQVLGEIIKFWPQCNMIQGAPRQPQTQESVELSNQDVESCLRMWMHINKTTKWSIGLRFVQYQKNSSHHRVIDSSPYSALFGCDPKFGL